ncbi:hypothetical protein As57867_003323, partial [Aphanomyces stellatus]
DHTETYTLVNDKAYVAMTVDGAMLHAACLEPSQVPSISLMQSSLEQASVVRAVEIDNVDVTTTYCDGLLLELTFAGEKYVLCASNDNKVNHIQGDDLDIAVEYLTDASDVPAIAVPDESLDCPVIQASLPNLQGLTERAASTESAGTAKMNRASCGCKGPRKPCLFVHGVGQKSSGPIRDSSDSWGSLKDRAPCCTSTKYVQFDTVSNRWDGASLQNDFCNAALQVATGNNGRTVGNLILVTYSMGNLIAGGAIANNRCGLSGGVSWLSLAGPMHGSKTINFLEQTCANGNGGWGNAALNVIAYLIGKCPAQPAYSSMKHQSTVGQSMQNTFVAAQRARAQHVTKVLCGNSPSGLASIYSAALPIVSQLSKHDTENDGVVDFNSCTAGVGTNGFGTSYNSANYKAAINHIDAAFRQGDGLFGDDRKPVKWFECAL